VTLQFVFHYPETNGSDGDLLDSGALDDVARSAETAGFDALALTEHPIPGARWLHTGGHQSLDPFVALAFAAAATSRLRLLTHLALAPYRNPFLLAKAAATVDKLSGGRMILGLGAGYQKSEFHALREELKAAGAWVFSGGLHEASTATVVRVKGGDVITTDGPYIEGKEHIGGFTVIKAPDLDAALEWARKSAVAITLPIEVRPLMDQH